MSAKTTKKNNKENLNEKPTEKNDGDTSGGNAGVESHDNTQPESSPTIPKVFEAVNIGEEINAQTPEATQQPIISSEPITDEQSEETNTTSNNESFTPSQAGGFFSGASNNDSKKSGGTDEVGDDTFNPSIHCVDVNGQPKVTKSGKFRRKPGRKNGEQKTAEVKEQASKFTLPPDPITFSMLCTTIQVASLIAAQTIGKEWTLTDMEKNTLADVYARYVAYKGWDQMITPEAVVISTTLAILGPRLMTPKFLSLFGVKFGNPQNAHSNNRTTGEGENIAGENTSETNQQNGEGSDSTRSLTLPGIPGDYGIRQ